MELQILKKTAELIRVEAYPGCEITRTCASAIAMAAEHKLPVQFDFNGVLIKATASDEVEGLVSKWRAELDAKAAEYKASPEGQRRAEEDRQRQAEREATANQLIADLPTALTSEATTVAWVGKFAEVSDYIGLTDDKQAVAAAFESAGYIRNDCVGNPAVKTNKTVFARWLVGQAIDHLQKGMGIHQVAVRFAAEYKAL